MTAPESAVAPLPKELLSRLGELLGAEGLLLDDEQLGEYRDPYWIPGDSTYYGAAVVLPENTEQVQAVVRLAGEFRVPLWTSSQGRNNGYGGASPRVGGSLQISMRRMNRVLEIDEELAYAVVEPGVRWLDLHAALEAGGHQLRLSVPDIGWGSVVGNSLDNGMTYMANGQDFAAPTGMEVVLPDGELLRTGTGAVPGSRTWHVYKRGVGPTLDPLFTQSNLGIVTKMGVWLQPTPDAYQSLSLCVAHDADLGAAVEAVRDLMLAGLVRGVPSFYAAPLNGSQIKGLPIPPGTAWTEEELEAYGRETGLGRWTVRTALWDDREVLEAKRARIVKTWSRIPGAYVQEGRVYGPDEYGTITNHAEKTQIGIPHLELLDLMPDFVGHMEVSPVVPMQGTAVTEAVAAIQEILVAAGFLPQIGVLAVSARAAAVVTAIGFDKNDADAVKAAVAAAHRVVRELGRMGYVPYRAHLDLMDDVAGLLSFNDGAYHRFMAKLKDAVDPDGVLSPGRYGVWPGGADRLR
ncbi:FAD-dependent oxidoreductase [Streptomyces sp. NPDC047081]|uniref:FAD-binding oxidoreductase n=1 Tax=Streptomyces sp. NPDC047081 TaxID=3154706 RepID=UPI0033DC3C44